MSCIVLIDGWINIMVLIVHKPRELKTLYQNTVFMRNLIIFPKYHTKITLDFNAKMGKENILTPEMGN